MRFPDYTSMLLAGTLAAAVLAAAATPASAAARANDVDYLNLARCTGLAEGMGRDASALKAALKAQGAGRDTFIYDRALEAQSDAVRESRRAGEEAKRRITAESDGPCAAHLQPAQVAGR